MAKDDYQNIGTFIAVVCAIIWMLMSDVWGADSNERINQGNEASIIVDCDRSIYL